MTKVDNDISLSVLSSPPADSVPDSPPNESTPSFVSLAATSPGKELKLNMSRDQLIVEQKCDQSLSPLFEAAVSGDEIENMSTGYFVKDDVLLRKWMPPHASDQDDWSVVTQIVVPQSF